MGQKINPNIFRLGINKKWKTEFFEKKGHELPSYTFKDLEIKSYVERFLETQGIILHDYKQHYSNSTLNLYISYFVTSELILGKKNKSDSIVLMNREGNIKVVESQLNANSSFTQIPHSTLFKSHSPSDHYNIKKYLRTHSIQLQNSSVFSNEIESLQGLRVEGVLENFFKVLSLFTRNKFNVIVNFCCLNKNLSFLKKTQRKNFTLLQKFKGTAFLKEGIELLFQITHNRNGARLLAKFIAVQIKKIKRHKFFLAFLKQTLIVMLNSSFSKVKGIKIIVKGRLNGVPRAKYKIISIGDVPVQSIKAVIDHAQMTAHNSNGSYGIKVWTVEKD